MRSMKLKKNKNFKIKKDEEILKIFFFSKLLFSNKFKLYEKNIFRNYNTIQFNECLLLKEITQYYILEK